MGKLTQILGSLIVLCQFLKLSEGAITFLKEPNSTSYVKKGNNATLVWDYTVTNKPKQLKAITWAVNINNQYYIMIIESKNGDRVFGPDIPPAYSERVGIKGRASLVIENITNQDNTFFQCTLRAEPTSGLQEKVSTVQLIVTEAPEIMPASISDSYNEGSVVTISCTATGMPEPDVEWKRNGKVRASGKKTARLTLSSINKTDGGNYTCTASNSEGRTEYQVTLVVNYPPTIKEATTSAAKSWIGQTVTLKCVSDGVPTPTLTWYKPDGRQIKRVTATQNSVNVTMNVDQDFGGYKCDADNGLTPADFKIVKIEQIKKPGAPTVVIGQSYIQATSLTVKWTAPADDGGSPITAYRVVILKNGTEIKNQNVTDPGTTSLSVGGLERDTEYSVKVFARNAVFEGPAGEKTVKTKYEGVPAAATIEDLPSEVTDDTITLRWSEPQNNGRVITQYTVYQRILTDGKQGEWTKIKAITDILVRELTVELEKGKVYEFVVTATNELGESLKEDGKIKRVKASGVPAAVEMYDDIPSEVTDSTITLKWKEPQNYGSNITKYTVYQRIVTDGERGEWTKLKTITNTSDRELKVELEKGKEYEFVVTATNMHGESKIEESKIKSVKVKGEPGGGTQTGDKDNGMGAAIYAGLAAAGVLLIIGIIVIIVLWRRRKTSSHDETSADELGSGNPYEIEDGYQSVSREAAQSLQASGPVAEPNYAQVDPSKKKKNRRPPTDEYAQVDKSKKTKKTPKKKPGELEYADLDDLRSDFQLAPVPGGAAAGPVVRPPAYEGTEYADIAQFGVPPPEPTYANVSKKDVVYSNVESM